MINWKRISHSIPLIAIKNQLRLYHKTNTQIHTRQGWERRDKSKAVSTSSPNESGRKISVVSNCVILERVEGRKQNNCFFLVSKPTFSITHSPFPNPLPVINSILFISFLCSMCSWFKCDDNRKSN